MYLFALLNAYNLNLALFSPVRAPTNFCRHRRQLRKTIVLTFCKDPNEFRWVRHIVIMLVFVTMTVLLVLYIPNIRDIFGFAGECRCFESVNQSSS